MTERARQDPISRRRFVRRTAELGMAAAAGGALAACAKKEAPREGAVAAAALGPMERELAVYNWSDYIAPDTVAGFEHEFGVKVTYDTYESNEELLAKLQSGAHGYDVVVPSSYLIPALQASHLLLPLHRDLLPNFANIDPTFVDPAWDPGNAHTVPYHWGFTGIAYRRDRVRGIDASQAVWSDPRWRRKMTMMDDVREVLGAMLLWRGRSPNSVDPQELRAARDDAVRVKPNLRAYKSAPVKADLIAGDVWVAQLWNGDATQAMVEQPAIAFAFPREGSQIWADSLAILADAPHPRAAHAFLNYVLRPGVGAAIANTTGYGTANRAAAALQPHPIPYPSVAELRHLEYQKDLGAHTEDWDRIWTEIKSA
jgi:spermidine/putrescine transport system substrate-binding protein